MVIDIKGRKGVFVHIPKCGGVSIEKTIHKALGGDNVISYNKLISFSGKEGDILERRLTLHSKLSDYRYYLGNDLKDYFVFGVVRNPWRRMVSHWEYIINNMYNGHKHKNHKLDFNDFVQLYETSLIPHNLKYDDYLDDGLRSKVNFVGKLENIENDIVTISDGLGLDLTDLLHMNQTDPLLKIHKNWKDYYTPGTIDMVYNICKEDIKKYNYEFEE